MSEEAKSLFEYKQELQSAIWFENAPLDATLDLAVQAVIEAGKPEQAGDYYRPCVHEDLLLVYQMMDLPGYAIELETIASRFIAEIPSSRQCHFCMATLHVQGLLGQRRYADADRAAALHLAELGPSPEHRNRRLDLVMLRADIAAAAGDLVALRLHVEELCRELPKISRGDNVLRAGIWRSPDPC